MAQCQLVGNKARTREEKKEKERESHFQHELINEELLCSMCADSHLLVTKNILAKKTKQNAFGYKTLYAIKTTN